MSSLQSNNNKNGKWKTLQPLQSQYPYLNPVFIGNSIWISTWYGDGERGIAEFCCETDAMKQPTPYPNGFKANGASLCGSDGSNIVVVDGHIGKLISFDTEKKEYGKCIAIQQMGYGVSSIMLDGNAHIIHGEEDSNCKYLVYSLKTGKVNEFNGNHKSPKMGSVSILKNQNSSKIYKFGGRDYVNHKFVDSFQIGKIPNGDTSQPIRWTQSDEFKLKKPMNQCGVIQYGPYILTFGGWTNGIKYLDDIYILDTRSKTGWIRSPIKCPMKSRYVAALDHKMRAHLFTHYNDNKQHYCIGLKELVPKIDISPMTKRVPLKGAQQIQNDDDDEKGGYGVAESAKLRDTNRKLMALNKKKDEELYALRAKLQEQRQEMEESRVVVESLKDEVDRVKRESAVHNERRKESRKKVTALEKTITELIQKQNGLEAENMRLKESESALKATNSKLEKTNAEIESVNLRNEEKVQGLELENKRLTDKVSVYEDEQKENRLKIAELEKKVKELELKTLNVSQFMTWNWEQIVFWIISIGDGKFKKYEESLKEALSEEEYTGEDLLEVTPLVMKYWGIKDRKERVELHGFIQELVQQNGPNPGVAMMAAAAAPKENEGAPTAFVG